MTTQSDAGPFAGTVWTAEWDTGDIIVLEPRDRESGPHWKRLGKTGLARQEVSWVVPAIASTSPAEIGAIEEYDPGTDAWRDVAPLPQRLDHIQGVALDGLVYYVGGLSAFPQPAVGTVSIYDPATDSFRQGAAMPRPRGAGGVAVHDGKIYYAGGLADGEAVAWFDVYDPRTDSWTPLPDMPRARDHFQAQAVGKPFLRDRRAGHGGRREDPRQRRLRLRHWRAGSRASPRFRRPAAATPRLVWATRS